MKDPINLLSKFDLFSEHWSPKVVAEMNNYQFKLVKLKGSFIRHDHKDTDEVFLVIEGSMSIELSDTTVELNQGEMVVVPRGESHRPFATEECKVLLVEPRGVVNTGDAGGEQTVVNDVWI
ncbi:MAG TPA: cupin domain-containing protein [Pseudomonadales bacterium]|jgi:mannose-6-phosphate isomerase-like protein (cupin superfamily)|nr:cupin domain-containing protein [Gammaproteobacteria bacterium]HIM34609.1 cupin domain-containing protein [Pseudomonadales bacterium]